MFKYKRFFLFFIFLLLSTTYAKSENKVSYIDIDFILSNTISGKMLLQTLKKEEQSKIQKFKINDEKFKNEEMNIVTKKNLVSEEKIKQELNLLQKKFDEYRKNKIKEIENLKTKRKKNILNFINLINPIIEKYMRDNSIYMLIDKKNVFIANKDYDITNILIELIDNQIKTVDIK